MQNSTLTLEKSDEFTRDNVDYNGQGVQATATAGASTNIDYKLLDDCFLSGGQLFVKNAKFGDSVTLQVVDKDNVLGFGAGVVLKQFITNYALRDDQEEQYNQDLPNVSKVIAGLYLRLIYNSVGTIAPSVEMNLHLYKAKY